MRKRERERARERREIKLNVRNLIEFIWTDQSPSESFSNSSSNGKIIFAQGREGCYQMSPRPIGGVGGFLDPPRTLLIGPLWTNRIARTAILSLQAFCSSPRSTWRSKKAAPELWTETERHFYCDHYIK